MKKSKKTVVKEIITHFNAKTIMLFLLDAAVISFSFFIALSLQNNFDLSLNLLERFIREMPIVVFIYWIIFELFGMYKSLWDFAGLEELIKGVIANSIATLSSYFIVSMAFENHMELGFYITALFIASFATIIVRLFYRLSRIMKKYFIYEEKKNRALIIGAGSAGVLVLNEIRRANEFDTDVCCFVDDDEKKQGKYIQGLEIAGTTKELEDIINERSIDIVFLAIPNASKEIITKLLNRISETNADSKLFPPFYEVVSTSRNQEVKIRDVKIEDLLGRDEIKLDETGIKGLIDQKTILVTGGGGSIGSELVRQIRHFNPLKIVIVDIYENNAYDLQMELARLYRTNAVKHQPEIIVLIASVRDEKRMDSIFNEYHPDVVFHAAAHKHVPLMEKSPKEAIKNNVFGTYNIAFLADKYKLEKFVLISTDKAVNPTNIMGATKRFAEKIVMAFNKKSETDYVAVRFGNVLGSNGSVIPLFKKQIESGGPVTVTHPDIIRYFMTIPEASQLVIQAGAYAKGGELFVLDMGEPVKITDLAEKMIKLSGFDPYTEIPIVFTGLRPGEKMYEELLVNLDEAHKTDNDLIFIEPNHINGFTLEILDDFKARFKEDIDVLDLKELVKIIIPEYKEI
ncbi:nucleoside-diphosphate sugar epimerase [Candidatus Izimaplasma bacterium ZiA1]|uniref:polysaccharide biosynthesis protein n=1 Tax=Candidatus Izimoplasma sp. ZiA1 TaxID=2024899 RepID=UPI000BAA83AE|nr:nucleoside-diphosphate sugar epimerase [Candidatus Izimaplasma bacterium ZiA1]